jgi:hypothetical protein
VEVAVSRWRYRVRQLGQGFDTQVALLELPFVVRLEQHGADQADDGHLGGKDADRVDQDTNFLHSNRRHLVNDDATLLDLLLMMMDEAEIRRLPVTNLGRLYVF